MQTTMMSPGKSKVRNIVLGLVLLLGSLTVLSAEFKPVIKQEPLASVSVGWREVYFRPKVSYAAITLSVSQPDGTVFEKTFLSGSTPVYDLPNQAKDGTYTFELRWVPKINQELREEINESSGSKVDARSAGLDQPGYAVFKPITQSGHFVVKGGSILSQSGVEPQSGDKMMSIQDVVHTDDVIITGSLGVGFDCADGESFGFDTIRLKEHNLRIHFDDTSYTAGFPTNSWRITINDSTSGGASYFSIDDVDEGTSIFKLEAGAPANSLYVEDYGRVGLGTSTPVVELHIKDSDTPTMRLEQDSSGGWTPQTWDVAGNESNFFIRDATNGSKLPFRIQPGTPSSTLCLKADGTIGIGTWSTGYPMLMQKTGTNASFVLDRTDGATNYINATSTSGNFGTVTNHPLRLAVNSLWQLRILTNGSLEMRNGASCSTGGVWTNASSRDLKENIRDLPAEFALAALDGLNPVTFTYKTDASESHVGFIAEDVPEIVATKDRKGMSPMDVVAVLTKVVQEQQKLAEQQQKTIAELQERISELEKRTQAEKKSIVED